jgi:3',5'-cyclic AMP phosphodiesterase CpdA
MKHQAVRIAHLTDIHVATNRDVWKTALLQVGAGLAVAAPVVAGIEQILGRLEQPTRSKVRIPVYALTAVTALAGLSLHPTIRRRILFLRDLALLINQSSEAGRRALFQSLRQKRVDHLLITGDLSTSSRSAEFRTLAKELANHGWEGDRVSVLPGNHDRIGFEGYAAFEDHFPSVSRQPVYELAPGVILAGVDSTVAPPVKPLWKEIWDDVFTNLRGQLAPGAVECLCDRLDGVRDETVVLGIHHPILDMRLPTGRLLRKLRPAFRPPVNIDVLSATLRTKNHLVLCGHDHPREPRFGERDGLRVAMGMASGLVGGSRTNGRRLNYRIFEVEPKGRRQVEDVWLDIEP